MEGESESQSNARQLRIVHRPKNVRALEPPNRTVVGVARFVLRLQPGARTPMTSRLNTPNRSAIIGGQSLQPEADSHPSPRSPTVRQLREVPMRCHRRIVVVGLFAMLLPAIAAAQWLNYPTPGTPRLAD